MSAVKRTFNVWPAGIVNQSARTRYGLLLTPLSITEPVPVLMTSTSLELRVPL